MRKVTLVKFIETSTVRFRLQRKIRMPIPQPGWTICGCAASHTISPVVDSVSWDAHGRRVIVVLKPAKTDRHEDDIRDAIARDYGPDWEVDEMYLTTDRLAAHMASLDDKIRALGAAN